MQAPEQIIEKQIAMYRRDQVRWSYPAELVETRVADYKARLEAASPNIQCSPISPKKPINLWCPVLGPLGLIPDDEVP